MRKIAIIPAYEPPNSFIEYASKLAQTVTWLIVVNDGSDMRFQPVFDEIEALPNATVISYGQNGGKGYALKQALRYSIENFDESYVCITADCDGQHCIDDIERVADAQDGRANHVNITAKGQEVIEQSKLIFQEIDMTIFEDFSEEELCQFKGCLEKILGNVKHKLEEIE